MTRMSRPVSWIRSALRSLEDFPVEIQERCKAALTIAAEGGKADVAKPLHGFGSGVFEIALSHRGEAYRLVYAVQLDVPVWVIHAFQKKSTRGIKTPKHELELIDQRIKQLKRIWKESR
jgi:phage-related protein